MRFLRSTTNRFRMLVLLAVAAGTLCACTPEPTPDPTPTAAFATEDEAFAAAEEVYRAYNDASNSGSGAGDFLTGPALESDIEAQRYLNENNLVLQGDSRIISFTGTELASNQQVVKIEVRVCLDVSESRVIDADGMDITPTDRADRWLLDITLAGSADQLSISDSTTAEDATC